MVAIVTLFNLALLVLVGSSLTLGRGYRVRAGAGGLLGCVGAVTLIVLFQPNVFGLMKLAAWAIFVHIPLFLVGSALLVRHRRRRLATVSLILALVIATVGVYAFFIEPRRLEVTHITLRSDRLERPLRIGIVSDLQTDSPGNFEREALRRLMKNEPDLILFSGDYLQVPQAQYADKARRLNSIFDEAGLAAPLGVYAVRGNTDPPRSWPDIFDGLPATPLTETTRLTTGPVKLTGLSLRESFDSGLTLEDRGGYHIVFGHAPDFSLGSVDADLLVAGHTHGGQVRLPWIGPLLTLSQVPDDWASGVTRLDDKSTLVVSRGIGMERGQAPRLRFLCRPELVIVDVIPEGS